MKCKIKSTITCAFGMHEDIEVFEREFTTIEEAEDWCNNHGSSGIGSSLSYELLK